MLQWRETKMTAFGRDDWNVYDVEGRRKYLSAGERVRFLAAADRCAPAMRALCHVLAYAGCRVSEALALTPCHIDAERLTLTFRTLKRRRTVFRTVPVPPALIELLRTLAPDCREGRFWTWHRVTAWRGVRATMQRAGIGSGPRACPKGLRHGFGICAAGHNIPVNVIQRWMGHASATTTAIYIDAVGREERSFARRMW
jgi:integrase